MNPVAGPVEADRQFRPLDPAAASALESAFVQDAPGAMEQVVALHAPRLTRLVHRLLGWEARADVEDVVQDVFVAALRHRTRFLGRSSLGTWLVAIAINHCRSRQRRLRLGRLLFQQLRAARTPDAAAPPAWDAPAGDETSVRVRAAVRALPPRDREVIVLRYFEQLSAAEIATVTKQSANAVEVRLHRARGKLSELLEPLRREQES